MFFSLALSSPLFCVALGLFGSSCECSPLCFEAHANCLSDAWILAMAIVVVASQENQARAKILVYMYIYTRKIKFLRARFGKVFGKVLERFLERFWRGLGKGFREVLEEVFEEVLHTKIILKCICYYSFALLAFKLKSLKTHQCSYVFP